MTQRHQKSSPKSLSHTRFSQIPTNDVDTIVTTSVHIKLHTLQRALQVTQAATMAPVRLLACQNAAVLFAVRRPASILMADLLKTLHLRHPPQAVLTAARSMPIPTPRIQTQTLMLRQFIGLNPKKMLEETHGVQRRWQQHKQSWMIVPMRISGSDSSSLVVSFSLPSRLERSSVAWVRQRVG